MAKSHNKLQLELHVEDFESIKEYYSAIGFRVIWERPQDGLKGYLVMEMDGNTLCFWGGNKHVFEQPHFQQYPNSTTRGYGVEVVIMVDDIEDYYSRVKSIANVVEPLIEQPWGLKDFRAEDPAGFYLRFTTDHNVLDSVFAVE